MDSLKENEWPIILIIDQPWTFSLLFCLIYDISNGSLGFGQFVGQEKQSEDVTLASELLLIHHENNNIIILKIKVRFSLGCVVEAPCDLFSNPHTDLFSESTIIPVWIWYHWISQEGFLRWSRNFREKKKSAERERGKNDDVAKYVKADFDVLIRRKLLLIN